MKRTIESLRVERQYRNVIDTYLAYGRELMHVGCYYTGLWETAADGILRWHHQKRGGDAVVDRCAGFFNSPLRLFVRLAYVAKTRARMVRVLIGREFVSDLETGELESGSGRDDDAACASTVEGVARDSPGLILAESLCPNWRKRYERQRH